MQIIQLTGYLVNFKFMIYLPRLGGYPLSSDTPSYPLPPKITMYTIHQLPTGHIWSSCISTFREMGVVDGGWLGVVIIKLKVDLNSTDTGLPTGTQLGKNVWQLVYAEFKCCEHVEHIIVALQPLVIFYFVKYIL